MKFIDLFAGIGGIRQGFEHIGWQCVFTSEWDKYAQQTYLANFGIMPEGDITKIDPASIPQFDALVAGSPCQPFSKVGHKLGFDDTRGTLFFDIARIIDHHKPVVVFLENVRNLLTHDSGNTFRIMQRTLTKLGYCVSHAVLNAKNFGVPQSRERLFIVALKSDHPNGIFPEDDFCFPTPPMLPTRLGDIMEPTVDTKYTLTDGTWKWLQSHKERSRSLNRGYGYTLFDKNSPYSNTISARYYKDGSEILIEQIGKNPRKLTPREAARLQGFPESFIIPVSDTQAYKQFGNSVAVPVIKAIAEQMAKKIGNAII
jgi:DNA (cytosine-5)-methyltransferase 1